MMIMFRSACFCAAAAVAGLLACALTGCDVGQHCPSACCPCDPCVCPGGCCPADCPASPFQTPANCPGGQCPAWQPRQVVDEAEAAPAQVNEAALTEPKGGPTCPTCSQRPSYRPTVQPNTVYSPGSLPSIAVRPGEQVTWVGPWRIVQTPRPAVAFPSTNVPTMPSQPPAAVAPRVPVPSPSAAYSTAEPKEGVFHCLRCKRAAVGREWHELWADDGTPLTFLCEQCWRSIGMTERRSYLDQYIESAGLSAAQRFYARAAIAEQR